MKVAGNFMKICIGFSVAKYKQMCEALMANASPESFESH